MTSATLLRVCAILIGGALSCAAQLPGITTVAVPDGTTGGPYSAALTVTGGTPPYSNWTVGAGALPPGLALDPNLGIIAGTPSASGMYKFWVTVQDSAGGISPAQPLSINTSVPSILSTTASMPGAVVGTVYSFALSATGGTLPYGNWAIPSGSLPQGLALNPSTGIISGTPIANGASNFTVTVQDSTGVTSAPQSLTLVVGVAIITNSLPKGTVNGLYNFQLVAGGGAPPYINWLVSSGVLPPGLTLTAATGLLSGTPTSNGSYSFSITAGDSAANTSTPQPFTLVIASPPVVLTGALQPGVPGVPYNATLLASGGSAPLTWAMISGSLPPGMSFFPGTGVISGTPLSAAGTNYSFSVQVTDAVGVASNPQPLSISISQAPLTVSPASLAFSATPGDPTPPAVQSISVFSGSNAVSFSATATTTSGGNWLTVTAGSHTPASVLVSVNTGGLSPNTTYHGAITFAGQNVASATVPVTLVVAAGGPVQLSVSPNSLALSYVQGNPGDQRYLVVNNAGGGTIHFTAQASTASCGNWLNLLTSAGSATSGTPGVVAVLPNPTGLSDKSCTGAITISDAGSGQSQSVPVTMTVSSQTQALLLTQTGMSFQTSLGAAAASSSGQTFAVINSGVGTVNWTASAQTLSGGNWLSVTPASGASTNGTLPTPVTVSVASQGLPPGQYYGSIQIASSTVGNSPQAVSVLLTVANAPMAPPPLTPSGVILLGQSSGLSDAQTVTLSNPWSVPLGFNSTVVTDNRINWLTGTPASGTIAATGAATSAMTLQANLKGLPPGLQHGVLRVAFEDGTVHAVDVYVIVPAVSVTSSLRKPGGAAAELTPDALSAEAAPEACPGSTGLVIVFRSPEPGFQLTAQVPVTVQAIAKDCGTGKLVRQSSGAAVELMDSSSPSSQWSLIDDGTGVWTGTWTPASASAQMNLGVRIDQYVGSLASVVSAQTTLSGAVNPAPGGAAGVVTSVMNGANSQYPGSVTPGGWVSLIGVGIGDAPASASPPLPNTLGGTEVLLQGQPLPLYLVNPTQVNALIPMGINANERQQLIVVRDGTESTAVDVRVGNLK